MLDHDINPDRAQVRDLGAADPWPPDATREMKRLRDEVAYLTRERDALRERAFRAEARLAQRVGCGGAA